MLLSKKGKNSIYVWPGCGYCLQEVKTDRTQLCIEELAYICIKSGKGYFIRCSQLEESEVDDFFNDESYAYCDLSSYGLENGFLLVENLRTENVELFS